MTKASSTSDLESKNGWTLRPIIELGVIGALLFIEPALQFKNIFAEKVGATLLAAHKFPFTTLHPLHRSWTAVDASRAAVFFLVLFLLGLAAPLRGGLRPRHLLALFIGCGLASFFFVPRIPEMVTLPGMMEHYFYINAGLSFLGTLVFAAWWVRTQKTLPRWTAIAISLPLWMSVHALASFFYVFSFHR